MIQELEEKSISYEQNINTYQGEVESFRMFRARNKCLDPILFWSGYAVAILIGKVLFFVNLYFVFQSKISKFKTVKLD